MATLLDAPKTDEKKLPGLESKVAFDAKLIDHLATFAMDHRPKSLP